MRDNVTDDLHARRRRINISVAHHELFQDIVLDGARELFLADALLFRGHDIARQNGQYRPVHGHGYRHLVQRDTVEQDLHVLHGVDRNARFAHVARHTRVIGIVAAVSGQVEGNGDALGATDVGRQARHGVRVLKRLDILGGVQWFDRDIFRGLPGQCIQPFATQAFFRFCAPGFRVGFIPVIDLVAHNRCLRSPAQCSSPGWLISMSTPSQLLG